MTGLYTLSALVAAAAVVGVELAWWRTGLFRRPAYWVTMAIVFGFQVAVDGWLTKLSSPVVVYNRGQFSGVRFPFGIPVEDFAYGFALVTVTLLLWVRAGGAPRAAQDRSRRPAPPR